MKTQFMFHLLVIHVILYLFVFTFLSSAEASTSYCADQEELAVRHKTAYQGDWLIDKGQGWSDSLDNPAPTIVANYMNPLEESKAEQQYAKTGLETNSSTYSLVTHDVTQVNVQCEAGNMASSVVLDTSDTIDQVINYGNVNSSYVLRTNWSNLPDPYSTEGSSIRVQLYTHAPFYKNFNAHIGGHDTVSLHLVNKYNELIGVQVVLYAYNADLSITPERVVGVDPNSNSVHTITHFGESTYVTTESGSTGHGTPLGWHKRLNRGELPFGEFFSFRMTYENLEVLLDAICKKTERHCYSTPDDWRIKQVAIHNELNTQDRDTRAIIGTAHAGFRYSITNYEDTE